LARSGIHKPRAKQAEANMSLRGENCSTGADLANGRGQGLLTCGCKQCWPALAQGPTAFTGMHNTSLQHPDQRFLLAVLQVRKAAP
jgi:hypothetical protein